MKKGNGNQGKVLKRLTPKQVVRAYCLHCVGGSAQDVKACDATDPKYHVCPFHPFRLGKGRPSVKVIRKFCLQCMGDYADFVRDCETKDCFCHPYRMGKNPDRKGIGRSAERMKAVRAQKTAMSKNLSGKFQRSPIAPTPTPPGGEIKKLSAENGISDHHWENPEGRSPSLQRNTPSFDLEHEDSLSGGKQNPGGIPDPTPGERDSSSTVKNHFPGITPGITPEGQAPDPSPGRESLERGRVQVKWEQIPLFSLKGIHNPYPGRKKKISGRKQASSIQK